MRPSRPWIRHRKRCNDVGAGGVSVAVGELAEFAVLMLIEAALVWCKEKVKAAMTGRWGKERPICKAVKYL